MNETRRFVGAAMLLGFTLLAAGHAVAAEETPAAGDAKPGAWLTDYDAAKALAAKTSRDMLIDFSGSDWCGWCIKLDKEVFSQEAFVTQATQNFVLVVLDFPRKPENLEKIPEAQRARNEALQAEFGVRGFPSVFLTDATGEVYARTGYRQGGPENYLRELAEFREQKARREKLKVRVSDASVTGLERAKLLDEFIQATPEDIADQKLGKEMAEIVALDSDNAAGLKAKYARRLREREASEAMEKRDFKKAIEIRQAIIDEYKPTGQDLQDALFAKSEPLFYMKNMEGLRASLEGALKAAEGEKAEHINKMLQRFFPEEKKEEAKQDAPAAAPQPAAEPK